ncbi:MAG: nucleotidyltransferase family protein [Anaerovoracaceae bacterium]|nr:nucleotidyltransferase family protein [Bacillota bacterium]MDY2670020.1 nucleotidyltransferase family protein [Anaerovoracaceae bacterium]
MNITGITAEYDPFHYGHLYQMKKAAELTGADGLIVVLGGDFLQRGTPCMIPKSLRARMAVDSGADLVLSMPYIYSVNSSSEYTRGAVSVLESAGCVDNISFGCENDDLETLEKAASASSDDENLAPLIKENLSKGISYAEALTRSAERFYGREVSDVLRTPNNLLACGYLSALKELDSGIKPVPVKRRESSAYGDASGSPCVSASRVRGLLKEGKADQARSLVPPAAAAVLKELFPDGKTAASWAAEADCSMLRLLRYRIMTSGRRELAAVYSAAEGIEARAAAAALADGVRVMDDFIDIIKTKRYTRSRISRMLVHTLMNFRAEDFSELRGVRYARVLGFSEKGREILSVMKKKSDMPVLSNLAGLSRYDEKVRRSVELDIRAAGLYNMLHGGSDITGGEYKYVPYRG